MKVINLNSKFELTLAQINFTESVIICGTDKPIRKDDSISILMNRIPVFLVDSITQEEYGNGDMLGFYQYSPRILGVETPVITQRFISPNFGSKFEQSHNKKVK